ncbi:MAG: energy transducer TonB [Alphaproteobacteria bacterium]|nr:energy transducer TonB [Alphaproteobacteria bacterium]
MSVDSIATAASAIDLRPVAGRRRGWRRAVPSAGTAVSFALHVVPLGFLLLLGHAATEPAGSAPGAPGIELAVVFGPPNATPTENPPPLESLPIPQLTPPPEPVVEEPPPDPPVVEKQPEPPPEPKPDVVLLEEEPPPPAPPKLHPEPPKPQPPPKPKPPNIVQKPAPKPVQQAAVTPTEPVAAPLGMPEAPKGPASSLAPPSVEPATGLSTPGTASGASAPADGGPLVLLDPAYREPPSPPTYPPRSILLGQQGQVIVRAAIDPRGTPEEVVVWTSSGFPLLDKAAVDAVKRWRFIPARRGGGTVAAWVQVPVNFKLR